MAATNNCQWLQDSLNWCEGRPEYPGIRRRVYYTAKNNILAYPKVPVDSLGRPTSGVLEGDFQLKEGTYFYYIDIVPERSQATSESQGEYPSQTSLNKGTFVHPGVGEEASMLSAYCHNSNNIYVYEDIDGRAHVIGCEQWPVKSTVNMDHGQGASGTAGTTLEVEATDKLALPRYVGKLTTKEGEVQCKAVA